MSVALGIMISGVIATGVWGYVTYRLTKREAEKLDARKARHDHAFDKLEARRAAIQKRIDELRTLKPAPHSLDQVQESAPRPHAAPNSPRKISSRAGRPLRAKNAS